MVCLWVNKHCVSWNTSCNTFSYYIFNPTGTKRSHFHLEVQSVPRGKPLVWLIKASQLMLYKAKSPFVRKTIVAVGKQYLLCILSVSL
jgi:hypothetical protein